MHEVIILITLSQRVALGGVLELLVDPEADGEFDGGPGKECVEDHRRQLRVENGPTHLPTVVSIHEEHH